MTVTKLEEIKKGKYRVYLNDEAAFVLFYSDLQKFSIKAGMVLSEELYQEIAEKLLNKRCRSYAMNLLIKKDRSERELRTRLFEAEYPEKVVEDAIEYLKGFSYIDDERYSENYIRANCSRAGLKEIKNKLRMKGIKDEDINSAIEKSYEDGILSQDENHELILRLLKKKLAGRNTVDIKERQKIVASVYRKGFELGEINSAFDEIVKELQLLSEEL